MTGYYITTMATVKNEFHCPVCDKFFVFSLSSTLNQNYRIHCPNCGHVHYRNIVDGIITDTRIFDKFDEALIADIRPMKSSCIDRISDVDKDSYFYHKASEGFLYRLWKEFKGHLV